MKNFCAISLMLTGSLALMSFTGKPSMRVTSNDEFISSCIKAIPPLVHATEQQATIIVDEDFSGLTKGSEEKPDTEDLLDKDGYVKDKNLFKPYDKACTATWSGWNLVSAGGAIAAMKGGFLNTPVGDYSGPMRMTCRIKLVPGQNYDNPKLDIILMRNSVLVDFKRTTITLNDQWQDIVFESDNGWYNDCMIQFFTMDTFSFLIDDIKITHKATGIEPPQATLGRTLGDNKFLATWKPTTTADEYLLSVFHKTENPDFVAGTEGFDSINNVSSK